MSMDDDDAVWRFHKMGATLDNLRSDRPSFFRALVWVLCIFVVALMSLPFLVYHALRPKDWNTRACIVKAVRARTRNADIVFTVDLENTTGDDLTLSPSLRFMVGARENGALQDSAVRLAGKYFIPGHHVGRVEMILWNVCKDRQDAMACYTENFGDNREIVFFEEGDERIEGHVPLPSTVPAGTVHIPVPDNENAPDLPADPSVTVPVPVPSNDTAPPAPAAR